jgi:hypothetical protein
MLTVAEALKPVKLLQMLHFQYIDDRHESIAEAHGAMHELVFLPASGSRSSSFSSAVERTPTQDMPKHFQPALSDSTLLALLS